MLKRLSGSLKPIDMVACHPDPEASGTRELIQQPKKFIASSNRRKCPAELFLVKECDGGITKTSLSSYQKKIFGLYPGWV